jgi:hypothetical protein
MKFLLIIINKTLNNEYRTTNVGFRSIYTSIISRPEISVQAGQIKTPEPAKAGFRGSLKLKKNKHLDK